MSSDVLKILNKVWGKKGSFGQNKCLIFMSFVNNEYAIWWFLKDLHGILFKLAGSFDHYYFKKYKSYNFWYGDGKVGKVILLEFRICPSFINLTQIEG